mgnify:CR=1 FL=1
MTPLTVTEFANAALSFPIIFVGDEKTPVAALGLNAGENLFIDAEGAYDTGVYIPAYIRRYPFVFSRSDDGKSFTLGIARRFLRICLSFQTMTERFASECIQVTKLLSVMLRALIF